MSNALEQSLDDIIGEQKKARRNDVAHAIQGAWIEGLLPEVALVVTDQYVKKKEYLRCQNFQNSSVEY